MAVATTQLDKIKRASVKDKAMQGKVGKEGDISQPSLLPYRIHNLERVDAHGSYTPMLCQEYVCRLVLWC